MIPLACKEVENENERLGKRRTRTKNQHCGYRLSSVFPISIVRKYVSHLLDRASAPSLSGQLHVPTAFAPKKAAAFLGATWTLSRFDLQLSKFEILQAPHCQ